jgi:hypothetical protein
VGQGEEPEGSGRAAVQGGAGRVSYSAALSDETAAYRVGPRSTLSALRHHNVRSVRA